MSATHEYITMFEKSKKFVERIIKQDGKQSYTDLYVRITMETGCTPNYAKTCITKLRDSGHIVRGSSDRSPYGWSDNPTPYRPMADERQNQFKVSAESMPFPKLEPRICHWLG